MIEYLAKMLRELSSEDKDNGIRLVLKDTLHHLLPELRIQSGKISRKMNISPETVDRYLYKTNILPLEFIHILSKNGKVMKYVADKIQKIYYRRSTGGGVNYVKFPTKIDEYICYIAGALRDGYLKNSSKRISIHQSSCPEWLEKVALEFKEAFDVQPKIREHNSELQVDSKALFLLLKVMLNHPPGNQLSWGKLYCLKYADTKGKMRYIQGYFDAEGEVKIDRKAIRIHQSWHNKNTAPSLLQIKNILKENKINSKIYGPYKHRKAYKTILEIMGSKNVELFYKKICSIHPIKGKELENLFLSLPFRNRGTTQPEVKVPKSWLSRESGAGSKTGGA